jgi:hypothetical protein
MADLQRVVNFHDSGNGHLGKWLHASRFCFLDVTYSSQYVYQILSESGDEWLVYSISLVLAVCMLKRVKSSFWGLRPQVFRGVKRDQSTTTMQFGGQSSFMGASIILIP